MGLNLFDLELLHHFTTSTALTLNGDPVIKTIWRINVPQIGFSYDFVMRGILALSSLHLARFRPEKHELYVSHAKASHQIGLRASTSLLPHVTQENCTALYIFSALTCMIALGSPRNPEDFLLVEDENVAEWLVLFRGTRSIISYSEDSLHSGVLGPMFITGDRRIRVRDTPSNGYSPEEDQLRELQRLIIENTGNQQHLEAYTKAIEELRKSITIIYKIGVQSYEPTDAFIWIFRVADEYLLLLKERTQEALAIFAHFCVMLKRLSVVWWIEGWSTHLLSQVYSSLDEGHRPWIRWPIEETGWVPPEIR
jgi:hypothetical protein